jgi:ABC-2 type transport system permease protein
MAKVLSGAVPGTDLGGHRAPIASVVHAKGVEAHLTLHWWIIVTMVPLACVTMASLGLLLGTSFEPRNIGLMFGFIILPITFLGGTYYQWTRLAPVKVGGWHWLQTVVLINPLIYVNEGMRAGLHRTPPTCTSTSSTRSLIGFCALFLGSGCATSGASFPRPIDFDAVKIRLTPRAHR